MPVMNLGGKPRQVISFVQEGSWDVQRRLDSRPWPGVQSDHARIFPFGYVMTPQEAERVLHRLRALMARTVANGCTAEEELSAARLVGRLASQLDRGAAETAPPAEQVRTERESAEYRALLERNTLEGLLKAAIQELALNHINTMAPPGRRTVGQPVDWVRVPELLMAHLSMMLAVGPSRLARDILAGTIEELVQDGQLPATLPIPLGR